MTIERLYRQFHDFAFESADEVYLPVGAAESAVDAADDYDVAILGIEIFRRTPTGLLPQPEIADFSNLHADSWEAYRQRCNELARQFLRPLTNLTVWVNFVFVEPQEWSDRASSRK